MPDALRESPVEHAVRALRITTTAHLLDCAQLLSAELAKRIDGALRFGLDQVQAGHAESNSQRVWAAFADLKVLLETLEQRGDIAEPAR